jgi:hypothetical protein
MRRPIKDQAELASLNAVLLAGLELFLQQLSPKDQKDEKTKRRRLSAS